MLALCLPHGFNHLDQFDEFDVLRAVGPVVAPANDDVTTIRGMAMLSEVAALKIRFDVHSLRAPRSDLPQRRAIRKSLLNVLHSVAQLFR